MTHRLCSPLASTLRFIIFIIAAIIIYHFHCYFHLNYYRYFLVFLSLSEWSESQLSTIDNKIVSVAVVYWSNNIVSNGGRIYTRWIADLENSEMKGLIQEMYMDAAWAYIVTWDKMKPNTGETYPTEVC